MSTDKKQETPGAAQPQPPANTAQKTIADSVLAKVMELQATGGIKLPPNYSAENALKSAFLVLAELKVSKNDDRLALNVCSRESIANALLKMVLDGTTPVKNQCYFICYGLKLTYQRSYMGNYALAKRIGGVVRIVPNIIYTQDVFEYEINAETGIKRVIKHEQKIENIDEAQIRGAYAIVLMADGTSEMEAMNMKQIRAAWTMGQSKGEGSTHKTFTSEMCRRTIINKVCKLKINTSDDATLFTEDEEDDPATERANAEIRQHANTEEIGFVEEPAALEQHEPIEVNQQQQPAAEPVKQQQQAKGGQQLFNDPKDPGF